MSARSISASRELVSTPSGKWPAESATGRRVSTPVSAKSGVRASTAATSDRAMKPEPEMPTRQRPPAGASSVARLHDAGFRGPVRDAVGHADRERTTAGCGSAPETAAR